MSCFVRVLRIWILCGHTFRSFSEISESHFKVCYVELQILLLAARILCFGVADTFSRPQPCCPDTVQTETLDWHHHSAKCNNSPICLTESQRPCLSVQLFEQARTPPLCTSKRPSGISKDSPPTVRCLFSNSSNLKCTFKTHQISSQELLRLRTIGTEVKYL